MQPKQIETFRGTHCQIGSAIGRKYAMAREYAAAGKEFANCNIEPETIKAQRRIYELHYPKFFDYTKGIASGGGYDEEHVFYQLACNGANTQKGCTIFGLPN